MTAFKVDTDAWEPVSVCKAPVSYTRLTPERVETDLSAALRLETEAMELVRVCTAALLYARLAPDTVAIDPVWSALVSYARLTPTGGNRS